MKHQSNIRTLGRKRDQRVALMRSLAENLIINEKILTTEARAKEVRPFVEKIDHQRKERYSSSAKGYCI